jgi:hypothetical protein
LTLHRLKDELAAHGVNVWECQIYCVWAIRG